MNNREIKFRVWDKHANFMWTEEGRGLDNRYDHENFGAYPEVFLWALKDLRGESIGSFSPDLGDYTLQQYVNLLDISNKEIYEGDIVKCRLSYLPKESEKITGVVEFSTETLSYILKFQNEGEIYSEELCLYRDFEVVGNIYENSSLAAELGLSTVN